MTTYAGETNLVSLNKCSIECQLQFSILFSKKMNVLV